MPDRTLMSPTLSSAVRNHLKELIQMVRATHDTDWPVVARFEHNLFEQLETFYGGSQHRHELWFEHSRMDDDGGPAL